MAMLSDGRGHFVNVNHKSILWLFGEAVVAVLVIILLFSSVARVDSGHVGVITLFGRVTGEVLLREST